MNTWAFNQLNRLSPQSSPANGPGSELERSDSSLSFPVHGGDLQAQLEAWTNVSFDFDSSNDFGSPESGLGKAGLAGGDDMTGREYYGRGAGLDNYSLGLDDSFGSILGVDPLLAQVDPFSSLYAPASAVDNSLLIGSAAPPALAANLHPSHAPLPSAAPVSVVAFESKVPAAKKRRASTSVGSASPETPVAESVTAGPDGDDELNAVAVEEDKRRRNTAASARFRIKKKQREAALESTAKELRDKVASLEREVDTLRTENGWLRGLVVG
ncbi:hypothetical protein P7C70_g4340, partial [Phenoliferia sp. Uapishka_3]